MVITICVGVKWLITGTIESNFVSITGKLNRKIFIQNIYSDITGFCKVTHNHKYSNNKLIS